MKYYFIIRNSFAVAALLFITEAAFAQPENLNPYSRYGLGDLQPSYNSVQAGMGGAGLAANPTDEHNFLNPASYSALNVVSFGAAVSSRFFRLQDAVRTVKNEKVNIGYLSLAFPIKKEKWGAGFGLLPFSTTGYNILNRVPSGTDTIDFYYQGTGGLNRVFIGTGYSITRSLSVGIKGSYLFGKIDKLRIIDFNASDFFNTRITNTLRVSGIQAETGASYNLRINEDDKFNIGVNIGIPVAISAEHTTLGERYKDASGFVVDTVVITGATKGKVELPLSTSAGIYYQKGNRWKFAIDGSMQQWENSKIFEQNDSLSNSFQVSAGGEFIPEKEAIKGYLKRVSYRLGGYYGRSYIELRNTSLDDYGITFGIGLPFRRSLLGSTWSYINLGIAAGERGTIENNLIREQYINLVIGFTLNDDSWFIKRRYN